jgi:hypothetical protein
MVPNQLTISLSTGSAAALWEDREELEDDWRDEKDARQIAFPRKAEPVQKGYKMESFNRNVILHMFSNTVC